MPPMKAVICLLEFRIGLLMLSSGVLKNKRYSCTQQQYSCLFSLFSVYLAEMLQNIKQPFAE